jgi:hypothetical protein
MGYAQILSSLTGGRWPHMLHAEEGLWCKIRFVLNIV